MSYFLKAAIIAVSLIKKEAFMDIARKNNIFDKILNQSIMGNKVKLFGFLFVLAIVSCESDSIINELSVKSRTPEIKSDLAIISSLGFDTTNVVVTDSFYIIEEDISFERGRIQEYINTQGIGTRQAQSSSIVSTTNVMNIKLKIDASLYTTSDWRSAILQAIAEYNNIGSLIHFVEVSSNYDLLIKEDTNLSSNVLGQGSWPSNGKVGSLVKINTTYNYLSLSQKIYLIIHELGHNLGLRHTNWNGLGESTGIGISGTPNFGDNPDPSSVMNGATGKYSWDGFSNYDLVALKTLYPYPSAVNIAGVEFFRPEHLYKPSTVYSYYTTNTPSGMHQWIISYNGATILNVTTNNNRLNLYLVSTDSRDKKDETFVFSVYSSDYNISGNKTIIAPDGYLFTTAPGLFPL